jgi:hypothetical protein
VDNADEETRSRGTRRRRHGSRRPRRLGTGRPTAARGRAPERAPGRAHGRVAAAASTTREPEGPSLRPETRWWAGWAAVRMALLAAGADKSCRMDAMAADEDEPTWRRRRFNTYPGPKRRLTTMSDQRRPRSPPTSPSRKSGSRLTLARAATGAFLDEAGSRSRRRLSVKDDPGAGCAFADSAHLWLAGHLCPFEWAAISSVGKRAKTKQLDLMHATTTYATFDHLSTWSWCFHLS